MITVALTKGDINFYYNETWNSNTYFVEFSHENSFKLKVGLSTFSFKKSYNIDFILSINYLFIQFCTALRTNVFCEYCTVPRVLRRRPIYTAPTSGVV